MAEGGFYRVVHVKGLDSMLTRTLVSARTRLVRTTIELFNKFRGLMKTFGLVLPAGKRGKFNEHVRELLKLAPERIGSIFLKLRSRQ
jgi:transposase